MSTAPIYNFNERLAFSQGARCDNDCATIRAMLPGCVECVKSDAALDRKGVDYIATLSGGATVYIDAKTRARGCSRFWKDGEPDLAIGLWSVIPCAMRPVRAGKVGWTFDEAKITDLILYTFDPSDCGDVFLLGFQTLRMAAIKYRAEWIRQFFNGSLQRSNGWTSMALFIPASVVQSAMRDVERRARAVS